MSVTRALSYLDYIRWLKAAYVYYFNPEDEPGMSDREWDELALAFYNQREHLPANQYPLLHDPQWNGGSLFWVNATQYPPEVFQ